MGQLTVYIVRRHLPDFEVDYILGVFDSLEVARRELGIRLGIPAEEIALWQPEPGSDAYWSITACPLQSSQP
jgi:hypothetical protein